MKIYTAVGYVARLESIKVVGQIRACDRTSGYLAREFAAVRAIGLSRTWRYTRRRAKGAARARTERRRRVEGIVGAWLRSSLLPWSSLTPFPDSRLTIADSRDRLVEQRQSKDRDRDSEREADARGASFGVWALTQGGIEGTREERRHQRERLYKRHKHLPRAHGVGPRSLIAPGPRHRLPLCPHLLPATKNHRLEKEKSATHTCTCRIK